MAYCTQADVQVAAGGSDRLRQLSDFESTGAIDPAVVAAAITEADGWINTFVHKRYKVDLALPYPESVVRLSASEAVFRMKHWRGMVTDDDRVAFTTREDLLKGFAEGKNTLGVSPQPEKSELVVDRSSARPTDKQVSRENTRGYW